MNLVDVENERKYIITRDSIIDVKDSSNAVYLTNLDELE
jgi:hypothetical protein